MPRTCVIGHQESLATVRGSFNTVLDQISTCTKSTPTRDVSSEGVIDGNTILRPQATYRRAVSIYSKVVGRCEGGTRQIGDV